MSQVFGFSLLSLGFAAIALALKNAYADDR
jgi:hypothetical protein